jgi:hypothetical protein
MASRIEIELTSERPDGTWTWRAAGAKQPKGDLDGRILPSGAAVGAVFRAEAEFLVDGIEIVAVQAPKAKRKEADRIEVIGSRRNEPLVTTQLAPKGRGRKPRRRDGEGGREGARDGERRRSSPRPDPVPERPTPKRLRAGRAHRSAVLDEVPPEQRPIAEQVLQGGVPAVREQARRQNEQARKENRPEIPVDQVVAMAEQLLPRLRSAEWRDRADAALRDLEELDLRDLRSVVVAADGAARDEEARALRDQLAEGLTRRVEQEQQLWVEDMAANLDAGRFVRALRISSRPPKAGAPVPTELNARLVSAVSEGLNERTRQDLYAATLDALSFAPMRAQVVPAGRPAEPGEDLLEAVRRVADKLPEIAASFGIDPKEANAARRRRRAAKGDTGAKGAPAGRGATAKKASPGKKGSQEPTAPKDAPAPEPPQDAPAPEPPQDAPAPEPPQDAPAPEAPEESGSLQADAEEDPGPAGDAVGPAV